MFGCGQLGIVYIRCEYVRSHKGLKEPSDAWKCVRVSCAGMCVDTVFRGYSFTYKGASLAFRIIYVVWLFVLQSKHLSPPIRLNDSTELSRDPSNSSYQIPLRC